MIKTFKIWNMKTGNKQTVKSLIDDISRLYKEKESILVPFVIRSIPTKVMDAFTEYPDYFVSSSVVTIYDGKRNLTLNLSIYLTLNFLMIRIRCCDNNGTKESFLFFNVCSLIIPDLIASS